MPFSNEPVPINELILPGGALPGTPRLLIGPQIPQLLVNFYAANSTPFNVIACSQAFDNSTNYQYIVWLFAPTTHEILCAFGNVNAGVVYESWAMDFDPNVPSQPRAMLFGDAFGSQTDPPEWIFNSNSLAAGNGYGQVKLTNSTHLIDTVDQGRGMRFHTSFAAQNVPASPGSLTVLMHNSFTFRNARAWEIGVRCGWNPSLSTTQLAIDVQINGTTFQSGGFGPVPAAGFSDAAHQIWHFKNGSGADKGPYVVNLVFKSSDAGTILTQQDSTHNSIFWIKDIGAPIDHGGSLDIP